MRDFLRRIRLPLVFTALLFVAVRMMPEPSTSNPVILFLGLGIQLNVLLAIFNLAGFPYPGAYDNFLIAVGIIINGVVVWYSWSWRGAG